MAIPVLTKAFSGEVDFRLAAETQRSDGLWPRQFAGTLVPNRGVEPRKNRSARRGLSGVSMEECQ
jgi:hypothetical protein